MKVWRCNHIKIGTTKTREQPKVKHRINYRKEWKMQKCQTNRLPHHLIRAKTRSLDDLRCCGQSCQTPSSLSSLTKERSAAHLVAPLPHPLPGVKWWEGRVQSSVYTGEEETVRDKSVTIQNSAVYPSGITQIPSQNPFTPSGHGERLFECDSLFWWVENEFQTTILCLIFVFKRMHFKRTPQVI